MIHVQTRDLYVRQAQIAADYAKLCTVEGQLSAFVS